MALLIVYDRIIFFTPVLLHVLILISSFLLLSLTLLSLWPTCPVAVYSGCVFHEWCMCTHNLMMNAGFWLIYQTPPLLVCPFHSKHCSSSVPVIIAHIAFILTHMPLVCILRVYMSWSVCVHSYIMQGRWLIHQTVFFSKIICNTASSCSVICLITFEFILCRLYVCCLPIFNISVTFMSMNEVCADIIGHVHCKTYLITSSSSCPAFIIVIIIIIIAIFIQIVIFSTVDIVLRCPVRLVIVAGVFCPMRGCSDKSVT